MARLSPLGFERINMLGCNAQRPLAQALTELIELALSRPENVGSRFLSLLQISRANLVSVSELKCNELAAARAA